jgi:hypothetical protein
MSGYSASSLRWTETQIAEIRKHAKGLVMDAKQMVKNAHDDMLTSVDLDLPLYFDIPNFTPQQSRQTIYSLVIQELTAREEDGGCNFSVKLNATKDSASLFITWLSESDELMRRHEKEVINYYKLSFAERKGKPKPVSLTVDARLAQLKMS